MLGCVEGQQQKEGWAPNLIHHKGIRRDILLSEIIRAQEVHKSGLGVLPRGTDRLQKANVECGHPRG